jgi:hypothetical protein
MPIEFIGAVKAGTSLNSASVGAEFGYRRSTFDVVTSLDFSFLGLPDGNYLGDGKDPMLDTHYTQFRNFNMLSADVSLIWHKEILPWLELRSGAGLGLGVMFGSILLTNNCTQCTAQNAGNTAQCYPVSPTVGPIMLNQPDTEGKLKATETGAKDTAQDPHRHKSSDVWPVYPVLNVLFGARFKVHRHAAITAEMGFRDAFFVGVGGHYLF